VVTVAILRDRGDLTQVPMQSLRERFGSRLRHIRRARDLTREEFAELVEISVDFLSLIERGFNAPSFETIDKMAERLKMPASSRYSHSNFSPALRLSRGSKREIDCNGRPAAPAARSRENVQTCRIGVQIRPTLL
jgi:transcriptional regulator with XRE-family HTH domain